MVYLTGRSEGLGLSVVPSRVGYPAAYVAGQRQVLRVGKRQTLVALLEAWITLERRLRARGHVHKSRAISEEQREPKDMFGRTRER
jgi:hypothetical protein